MKNISRILQKRVKSAARAFSAVVITGPRRSGKTWLLQSILPRAQYYLFEDPDLISRFRADPQGFTDAIRPPAVFDEIQNVPEVFNYLRSRIDANPHKKGQWFLTCSQESALMQNVSESMAGRAAILHLLPLSSFESTKVSLLRGGYPEVVTRPRDASLWFASYTQTYLERDVRQISSVQDLPTFRRFMSLLATRHGAILNLSDLATPLGVSVPSVSRWIDILEATGLIIRVSPYHENLGKRMIKSPKIYWVDAGLACYLLGIQTEAELVRSPFLGAIFEGAIAAEIIKSQINRGEAKALYYFRDQQGLEVDFIMPRGDGYTIIEAKATHSPHPNMAKPMQQLSRAWQQATHTPPLKHAILVHRQRRANSTSTSINSATQSSALAPNIKAMDFEVFVKWLN